MSKRPADAPVSNSDKKKRKHLCLSIAQKVKLLEKLDSGISVKRLTEEYGVGMTTIYDLKKQKDKLLKFYAESDEPKLMKNRKTLHKAKNEDLDRVLKEWIRQRRNEHMPLNGMLIMKQAKIYHDELKIQGNCEYSTGWLQKFKKRHGIKFLKICGDKAAADHKAAEKFIKEVDIKKVFHINNQPPVVHSLANGEIPEMVLHQGEHDNSDDKGDVNTAEQVPVDNMVRLCDGLIKGLEQRAFITEQEIMSVYKIKERLLRQKLLLMRQTTLEKTFKKATQHNASSSLEDPLPGPSTAPDVSSHLNK
ncbi:small integral membrane protein 8 isoform X1 [Sciurus carolinensis]|uniref:small integral membrane protein 8 isoform X1 n=1 Tax=Sciurus carolinensis TaxID=30640 RepID=UPI001FB47906|nr:small integral membrane protein 8 isoform X1 [Sciurus carolinensis]XP_047415572.1 small integral membrane protein 8 isoform X1 [Sciurus carolinensis]